MFDARHPRSISASALLSRSGRQGAVGSAEVGGGGTIDGMKRFRRARVQLGIDCSDTRRRIVGISRGLG